MKHIIYTLYIKRFTLENYYREMHLAQNRTHRRYPFIQAVIDPPRRVSERIRLYRYISAGASTLPATNRNPCVKTISPYTSFLASLLLNILWSSTIGSQYS